MAIQAPRGFQDFLPDATPLWRFVEDTARLARLEGLEGHARAALARSRQTELRQGRSPVSAAPRDASTPPPTGRPR